MRPKARSGGTGKTKVQPAGPKVRRVRARLLRPAFEPGVGAAEDGTPVKNGKLCCDACDGEHLTSECPVFKGKPREKHKDAQKGKGKDMGSSVSAQPCGLYVCSAHHSWVRSLVGGELHSTHCNCSASAR